MARPRKEILRNLDTMERQILEKISRMHAETTDRVARAKALLAVADGFNYAAAAARAGYRHHSSVSRWVRAFNRDGLRALEMHHGGGKPAEYALPAWQRIMQELQRGPDREADGTATWSLSTLQRSVRQAPDGLPHMSRSVIWQVLRANGWRWQRTRSWCQTGTALRRRKAGTVIVSDPDTYAKQANIERAYRDAERFGIALWTQDEAGPFSTVP